MKHFSLYSCQQEKTKWPFDRETTVSPGVTRFVHDWQGKEYFRVIYRGSAEYDIVIKDGRTIKVLCGVGTLCFLPEKEIFALIEHNMELYCCEGKVPINEECRKDYYCVELRQAVAQEEMLAMLAFLALRFIL